MKTESVTPHIEKHPPVSVKDRQEHGQDVYTAQCKHFV